MSEYCLIDFTLDFTKSVITNDHVEQSRDYVNHEYVWYPSNSDEYKNNLLKDDSKQIECVAKRVPETKLIPVLMN